MPNVFEGIRIIKFILSNINMNFQRLQLLIALWVLLQKQVNSLRRRHYLTRKSLTLTDSSAWRVLLQEKNNLSFINTTGLNRIIILLFFLFLDFAEISDTVGVLDLNDDVAEAVIPEISAISGISVTPLLSSHKSVAPTPSSMALLIHFARTTGDGQVGSPVGFL